MKKAEPTCWPTQDATKTIEVLVIDKTAITLHELASDSVKIAAVKTSGKSVHILDDLWSEVGICRG